MKNILTILTLCLLIGSPVFAQDAGNIEGTVTDVSTGESLPGVNIILKGTYYGAATDIDGKFRINSIALGEYNITVSLIGYTSIEYTGIAIEPNKTIQLDVLLEETAEV